MSKGLRNIFPESERWRVIRRRLERQSGGLGYLAAKDAAKKIKSVVTSADVVDNP